MLRTQPSLPEWPRLGKRAEIDVHRREATLDDVFLTLTRTEPVLTQEAAA